MKLKSKILIAFLWWNSGCTSLKPSESENKAIAEVIETFGGVINSSKSWKTSTDEENYLEYRLVLSNSETLEKYNDRSEMVASGMAYLFYKNVKDEKQKVTHVIPILSFKDGKIEEYMYDRRTLDIVLEKMRIAENVARLIKEQRYDDVNTVLNDSSYYKYNKAELLQNLKKADTSFGKVLKFLPVGFKFYKVDGGKKLLHLSGFLVRDGESNEFSINVDPLSNTRDILSLEYTL